MSEPSFSETENSRISNIQEYRTRLHPDNPVTPEQFSDRAEYDDATLASFYLQEWSLLGSDTPTAERIIRDIETTDRLAHMVSDDYLRAHGATLGFAGKPLLSSLIKTGLTEPQARAIDSVYRVHFVYQVAHRPQTSPHPMLHDIIQAIMPHAKTS
jgi:hypothetical protein